MIYLDNAASSHPKPERVVQAVVDCLQHVGANPGRSGHRLSLQAARILFSTRESLASLLGVSDSRRIIFTPNATAALNLALMGTLEPGDHVITSSVEHHAVGRPLTHLASERGLLLTVVPTDSQGRLDPGRVRAALTQRTRLVAIAHASNVLGTILPVAEIKEAIGSVPLLVDAAQSAGALSLNVDQMGIDLLAFTGHKALQGPQGTGGLVLSPKVQLRPVLFGGTGSAAEFDRQPDFLPDRFESGTCNTPGIAGLGAASDCLLELGVDHVHQEEMRRFGCFLERILRIGGLHIHGPTSIEGRLAVVSFTMDGKDPSVVGRILDERYGILVRTGLHCAPWAHKTAGTFPDGTIRISASPFTTEAEFDRTAEALSEIARS